MDRSKMRESFRRTINGKKRFNLHLAAAILFLLIILSIAVDPPEVPTTNLSVKDCWLVLAESNIGVLTVRKNGTNDYTTITNTFNNIRLGNRRRTIISIGPDVYWEKVTVQRPFMTFYDDTDNGIQIISFNGDGFCLQDNG